MRVVVELVVLMEEPLRFSSPSWLAVLDETLLLWMRVAISFVIIWLAVRSLLVEDVEVLLDFANTYTVVDAVYWLGKTKLTKPITSALINGNRMTNSRWSCSTLRSSCKVIDIPFARCSNRTSNESDYVPC